jgi:WD40 repeat protein
MTLSEFEKQRQENIQRNKELLRQLDLESLNDSIKKEVKTTPSTTRKKRTTKSRPVKKEPQAPSRKSRRIAGIKTELENPEESQRIQQQEQELLENKKQLEKLKSTRLFGDFKLIDLITDKKLGNLIFEDKVIGTVPSENSVKTEESEESGEKDDGDNADEIDTTEQSKVLQLLQNLGQKFSAGDFYDLIKKSTKEYSNEDLQSKRKEFDNLSIYQKFDPLDIKITHNRITSISFHPDTKDRIIVAGDTTGDVGIWAVDAATPDEVPAITILKPHGKSISRIITSPSTPSNILTSSYDGSVRMLDLHKLDSSEVAYLNDPYETDDYPLGVSDINLCYDNPHILYMTTLSGNFYQYDMRTKFTNVDEKHLVRLHDKKIGSFSINPNRSYQIATASLDRSLRIWDLRKVNKTNGKWSEFIDQFSPHLYGGFTSRLSISGVDWNHENRLVCNGYDDHIYVFDLNGTHELPIVNEWKVDYVAHSTKTKKTKKQDPSELPLDNLVPMNKIRHNCQTGRWVSILKSKWQSTPKDGVQKFVIANMNRGLDIYDQEGKIIGHLNESVGAVPAVCGLHPTNNWVVGGSASGKMYLFE